MTIRFLKQNKKPILGKNGKKLRYEYDKINKKIICKNKSNWTEEAEDIIEEMYDDYSFEYEESKRGRPKQKKTKNKTLSRKDNKTPKKTAATCDTSDEEDERIVYDFSKFKKGKRVKYIDNLSLGIGVIVHIFKKSGDVIISFDTKKIKCNLSKVKGVRGRAPKKVVDESDDEMNCFEEKEEVLNENDIDVIKIDDKLYLINTNDDLFDFQGNYIGFYKNEEITLT